MHHYSPRSPHGLDSLPIHSRCGPVQKLVFRNAQYLGSIKRSHLLCSDCSFGFGNLMFLQVCSSVVFELVVIAAVVRTFILANQL